MRWCYLLLGDIHFTERLHWKTIHKQAVFYATDRTTVDKPGVSVEKKLAAKGLRIPTFFYTHTYSINIIYSYIIWYNYITHTHIYIYIHTALIFIDGGFHQWYPNSWMVFPMGKKHRSSSLRSKRLDTKPPNQLCSTAAWREKTGLIGGWSWAEIFLAHSCSKILRRHINMYC